VRAFKVRRDGAVIIAPAVAYGEIRQDRGRFHGGPVERATAEESLFGNLVEPRSELEKFQEAALIARLDLTHCLKPFRERGRICEARAVVINVIAERAHGRERQVFPQGPARGLKEVFKDPRHRNQRRSGVEAKSALGPKIHLAAEAVALFADSDAPVARRQAQSDCQSAQPAADDDRMFHILWSVNREIRQRRAFIIVHRSFFICHCPEIAECSLGIDPLLRLAMTNDR
jgi:hypothetical protein